MSTLVYKLSFVLLPMIAIFFAIVSYVDHGSYEIFNDDLENKIVSLSRLQPGFTLVIAGDSRGERQVVPSVFESKFNIKTINIAASGCDIVTAYNALKKYGLLEKPLTVIVSASFFQVNDGAIDTGNIPMAELINMSLMDKARLFRNNSGDLSRMYFKAFQTKVFHKGNTRFGGLSRNDPRLMTLGFNPVEGNLKLPVDFGRDPETTKHFWYKNINIHGSRWGLLQKTLKNMSESQCRFILYQPPVSNAFKEYVKGSLIDNYEKEYSGMLANELRKYKNIFFMDYYSTSPDVLANEDYYDPQHLNKKGAIKFTAYLIDNCMSKSLFINKDLK